ncbi:MAG TPA: hypothetical protein VMD97_11075 [Candidatus Aquilonibacter sp.]|nr:hypothetical protein [Candidatus Aquilonibacter sp.]
MGELLGWQRMMAARVALPTAEDFPDPYDGSEGAVRALFLRVARSIDADVSDTELRLFSDAIELTQDAVLFATRERSTPGGVYIDPQNGRKLIAIHDRQIKDPGALVAVLAHELGHLILLGGGLVDRNSEDMEELNDLLTVFLGYGVFNANAAFRFSQSMELYSQGWSMSRLGYLPEQVWGYALARFAFERNETSPEWARYLSTSIKAYFKSSVKWLERNGERLTRTRAQIERPKRL